MDYTSGTIPPDTYTFTYEVSTAPGSVPAVTEQFIVEVELVDPCENVVLLAQDQTDPPEAKYDNELVVFIYNPYTVTAEGCPITVSC